MIGNEQGYSLHADLAMHCNCKYNNVEKLEEELRITKERDLLFT